MTLGPYALAAAILLAVLLIVHHARRSHRRQDTWICRLCEEGFSELPAAEAHLLAVHHRTP